MPLPQEEVADAIGTMKQGGYRGANVTSPHKRLAAAAMDRLSSEAVAIGAVNTLVFDDGVATGHNTDAAGFARSLGELGVIAAGMDAAVIGTGGAAAAAIHALLALPELRSVTIYSRSALRAEAEASRWHDRRVRPASLGSFRAADLVVHSTPVGLPGSPGAILSAEKLSGTGLLFEMIYWPAETPLMRCASEAGVPSVNGWRMFLYQALESYRLWTGIEVAPGELPDDILNLDLST
jgi:shikimate dehydrogenase